jgi:hypothetical protein
MSTSPDSTPTDMQAADERNGEPAATDLPTPDAAPAGQDTATGTDPDATYDEPGYQDKSLGQAVEQDAELAEELLDETGGDEDEAARRFEQESAGRHVLEQQDG